jgi:toxin YhaV
MQANEWQLFYFKIFKATLDELEATVNELARRDPKGYKSHQKTMLLASVYHAITSQVPADPDAPEFRRGKTLKSAAVANTHWRRVKKGMQGRYRLFFRFASSPIKLFVYVWFKDENTLRKAGAKTDVYDTIKRMLAKGVVPQSMDELLAKSQASFAI